MNLRSVLVGFGLALALPGLLVLPTHSAHAQKSQAKVPNSGAKKARRSKIAEREAAALEEPKTRARRKRLS